MSLPAGWRAIHDAKESGQAWVYPVIREGNASEHFALKRLKNPRRRDRFAREVRTMKRLRDEGILAIPEVVAFDLDDKNPWFVMPWFERGSLEDAIVDQRFLADRAAGLETLLTLGGILSDVHAAGVAHRDLKPPNVLIGEKETLALADFGLCLEVTDEETRLSEENEAVGSWLYMAWENEPGMNEELDQRPADCYAFGKVTWALLAGRQPLPRERILDPENQLAVVLADLQLQPIDHLLHDLLVRDPRGRLTDWTQILREFAIAKNALLRIPEEHPRPASEKAIAAARRLRSSPRVFAVEDQARETRRRETWFRELEQRMLKRAYLVQEELAPIIRELGDVLTIAVTTGAGSLKDLVERSSVPLPPVVSRKQVIAGMSSEGEGVVVFLIHQNQAIESMPTLTIRLWITGEGNEIWLTRLPLMSVGYTPETIPRFLLDAVLATRGPLAIMRQTATDTAERFVDETGRLFITIVEHYLDIVDSGMSPADSASWEGRKLILAQKEHTSD